MAEPGVLSSLLITMMSSCGFGNPTLTNMTDLLAGGLDSTLAIGYITYLATAPILLNAYFDNGNCGPGGTNCSTVSIGFNGITAFTSMDLSPPYGFSAPFGFSYMGSNCATGIWCPNSDCLNGIGPSEVQCVANGTARLVVLFCPAGPEPATVSTSWSTVPATSVPDTSSSTHSRQIGAIVGGVLGGITFLTIIALVVFFVNRRRGAPPNENREKIEFNTRTEPLPDPFCDPFRDPSRSSSPAGMSVIGETPMKVVSS